MIHLESQTVLGKAGVLIAWHMHTSVSNTYSK